MIKQNPRGKCHSRKLSKGSNGSRKSVGHPDAENMMPALKHIPFNTKGYFSSSQPYAEDYLKVKQEVFKKYRNTNQELVVIDPKLTKPSAYIQKGLLKPNNSCLNEASNTKQKVINNFIKNYMHRKEKREAYETDRYFGGDNARRRDSNPMLVESIESLYPTISVKGSRPVSKGARTVSRVPTSKSSLSNKEN